MSGLWKIPCALGGIALFALAASCTRIGNLAEERADIAAYGNIRGAREAAHLGAAPFTIGGEECLRLRELLAADRAAGETELLSLADVLAVAVANSRAYRTRKENLFIQALNLATVQKQFNFNYSAKADASTSFTTYKDGTVETFGDSGLDVRASLGATRLLATGARVSLNFSQNLLRYYTNPDASDANNALTFRIVQPLLNGFGPLVTQEPLRQAERDMVYAVRDFRRFQQEFVIDIAEQYYATLRARDRMLNERKNYESTIANREQAESYAKAGRIADFQAAQALQSELNAADRWVFSRSDYQRALDDLRYTLGLPIELDVEPDPDELAGLAGRGLVELDITLAEALATGVSNRLDLASRRDRVEDRRRKLEIQRRNFLPSLDVDYSATKRFDSADGSDVRQNLGVGLELPFDWTERRNAYRIAQINLDREVRALGQDEDDMARTVRDLWRRLERNRSIYTNRQQSVKLAERRVENTTLLLKQGKALTRDLLDAQDDLLNAMNEATTALVDYTINRLRFWNAIERFEIDPKGMWYELADGEDQGALAAP